MSSSPGRIRRVICDVPGGAFHVLTVGHGPAVLVLHDVPGNAAAHEEDALELAATHQVILPDLPGCGLTRLVGWDAGGTESPPGIEAVVSSLRALVEAWELDRLDIVGFGIGAKLARVLVSRLGPRVARVFAIGEPDGPDVFEMEELVAAQVNGVHVLSAWCAVRERHLARMRIPHAGAATDEVPSLPRPLRLHHETVEVLCGSSWRLLASAVMESVESAGNDGAVSVVAAPDVAGARARIVTDAREAPEHEYQPPPTSTLSLGVVDGVDVRGRLVATSRGHVFVRTAGDGPPVLLLHQSMESSEFVEALLRNLAQDFSVYAPDTLGCGFSDAPDARSGVEDMAATIGEVLDALGLNGVRLWAVHSGCAFGLELVRQRPELISSMVLNGVPMFAQDTVRELAEGYFWSAPHKPDRHGLHLIRLWSIGVDMSRYFPWFRSAPHVNRMKPVDELQRRFATMLRNVDAWHVPYRAALTYDPRESLRTLAIPTIVVAYRTDPLAAFSQSAEALNACVVAFELDPDVPPTAAMAELVRRFDELHRSHANPRISAESESS